MQLADRLVAGVLLPRLGAALGAGIALYAVVELIDLANAAGGPSLLRYPLRLPLALVLVSPVAALIAGAWTGVHLARTGQLLALAAAGRSPRRALATCPAAGAVWGALVWAVAWFAAPASMAAWSGSEGEIPASGWAREGSVLYRVGARSPEGATEVLIFTLDDRGLPRRRIEAERAELREGRWVLRDLWELPAGEAPRRREILAAPVPLDRVVGDRIAAPPELSGPALIEAARLAEAAGADAAPLWAEAALRIALALACLVCLALGAVTGARWGRGLGTTAALVSAWGLVTWLLLALTWTFAAAGQVPAWTVVVVPISVTGSLALGLLWFLSIRDTHVFQ